MSAPYYADESVTLWHGDALDVLRTLPDASVDAVVTDPPYGLEFMGKDWDAPWKPSSVGRGVRVESERAAEMTERGKGHSTPGGPFLASRVDSTRVAGKPFQDWCEAWSRECLRVLKPGGHLLAFGGSRTWHRLACAVEDAGFEVRDSIAWLYGSGFPKSLDVSKAIDARANVNEETKRRIALVAEVIRTHREAKGMERAEVSRAVVGSPTGACWNWEHHQLPSVEMWPAIKRTLDIPDKFDGLIEGDRAQFIAAERAVLREREGTRRPGFSGETYGEVRVGQFKDTAPATPEAERWQGWGTALKPAFEPIVVARKPLVGTVAANVLAHGTGALNIDACRVASSEADKAAINAKHAGMDAGNYERRPGASLNLSTNPMPLKPAEAHAGGRWPANVVLDDSQAAALDEQSGERPGRADQRDLVDGSKNLHEGGWQQRPGFTPGYNDNGGASRFFPTFRYEAKAPTSERPRVNGTAHPTVKPLDLMRWLVRLVTPPGGVVLEPFAGSGATAEACVIEGFHCIAIEREADYLPLIRARLEKPIQTALGFEEAVS